MNRARRILALLTIVLAIPATAGASVAGVGLNTHWELGAGYRNGFETVPVPTIGLSGVKGIASGDAANLALLDGGTVLCWGGNVNGNCGNANRYTATRPVQVHGLTGVVQVAMAAAHGIALKADGTVWTWGSSIWGQEGNGRTCHGKEGPGCITVLPVQVKGLTATAIYAGGADNAALLANGTVEMWGVNVSGQLGDGTTVEKDTPIPVKGVTGVKQVAIGGLGPSGGHTLFLLNDGTVVGVGANGQGMLGNGSQRNTLTPVLAKLAGVESISTSASHSLAVLNDGTVDAFGSNGLGELGLPTVERCAKGTIPCATMPVPITGLTGVTQAVAGFRFSTVVSEGHAVAFGDNQYGQLGDGTRTAAPLPGLVQELTGVTQVASGEHHAIFLFTGAPPPATISITEGTGALAVAWRSSTTTERWAVSWRKITKPASPWGPFIKLPTTARSYTVTGLAAGAAYEVIVQNASFGKRVVEGVPG